MKRIKTAIKEAWQFRRGHIINSTLYVPFALFALLVPVIYWGALFVAFAYVALWTLVNITFERQIAAWIDEGADNA